MDWGVATFVLPLMFWCQGDVVIQELSPLRQHMGAPSVGNVRVRMQLCTKQSWTWKFGWLWSYWIATQSSVSAIVTFTLEKNHVKQLKHLNVERKLTSRSVDVGDRSGKNWYLGDVVSNMWNFPAMLV